MTGADKPDFSHSASQGALLIVLALAGFAGAAGVALAAVAAHRVTSPALATAATMLMIHAGVAVAILAHAMRHANAGLWIATAALMLAAVTIFGGDIATNTLGEFHLFPMAAPIGGSLLIASWVLLAIVALASALSRR
jgi:uncharacterized membrane protein YgdD (TMEM256/DUF423 family)